MTFNDHKDFHKYQFELIKTDSMHWKNYSLAYFHSAKTIYNLYNSLQFSDMVRTERVEPQFNEEGNEDFCWKA